MPGIGNRNPEGVRLHNHRIVGTGGNPDQEKGQEQYVSISHPDVDRLSVTFEQQFGGKIVFVLISSLLNLLQSDTGRKLCESPNFLFYWYS